MDECVNGETEHYNFGLKITMPHSFISGNTLIETDIYIGFSLALHLQCMVLKRPFES
jgi:hypothetical protein